MLLIQVTILLLLLWIFIQDMMSRAVYWMFFPALIILMIGLGVVNHQFTSKLWWSQALLNIVFLLLQFILMSIWFSVTRRRWVNIVAELIGWGDILLMVCIAFYLSILNFMFFYIASVLFVLIVWAGWQLFAKVKSKQVPFAGLQALAFAIFLSSDWFFSLAQVTDDEWLQKLLVK